MRKLILSLGFGVFLSCGHLHADGSASALAFSEKVPEEVRREFMEDLNHLRHMTGTKASPLHREIFGPLGESVNGEAYYAFFNERVKRIDIHPSQKDFFVTAGGADSPGVFFISPEFLQLRKKLRGFERLSLLIHEARHNEPNNHWNHVVCPDKFLDSHGKAMVTPWGQSLAGKYACDNQALGSYGITYVFARNIFHFCKNCSPLEKAEAQAYGDNFLTRITDPAAKARLVKDSP